MIQFEREAMKYVADTHSKATNDFQNAMNIAVAKAYTAASKRYYWQARKAFCKSCSNYITCMKDNDSSTVVSCKKLETFVIHLEDNGRQED